MEKRLYQEHYELEGRHWWFLAKKKIIMYFVKKYIKQDTFPRILDAGCGTGLMLGELKKVGDVSGMDYSADAIGFCRIKYGDQVKQGWLPDQIPFGHEKFDMIICLDVIEHVKEDRKSIMALSDSLSDDGTLVLTVPALDLLWSQWDELNKHERRYNKRNLVRLFEQSGLKIEKVSYFNFFLFIPILLIRFFNNIFKRNDGKSDTDMPSKPVNFLLEKIFSLERFLLPWMSFPIGVSLILIAKKYHIENDK